MVTSYFHILILKTLLKHDQMVIKVKVMIFAYHTLHININ